jgi:hypothetical protein
MFFDDDDHTKADKDIDARHSKVKEGGIICGHDYAWACVYGAVNSRFINDYNTISL